MHPFAIPFAIEHICIDASMKPHRLSVLGYLIGFRLARDCIICGGPPIVVDNLTYIEEKNQKRTTPTECLQCPFEAVKQ
jgi:hypothetical protein